MIFEGVYSGVEYFYFSRPLKSNNVLIYKLLSSYFALIISWKSIEYQKDKSQVFRIMAANEPVILHLKHDCRMLHNFRIALREIKEMISFWFCFFLRLYQNKNDSPFYFPNLKPKMVLD